jgi:predicted RNA-binding protein associated with RNAse of E/G family
VRFVLPEPIQDIPAGTATLGFFWRDRTYNLYRFVAPDLGYRFDVVTEVRIEPDRIEYLDLLLDVRVLPDGSVRVEDEDEVVEAARSGLLDPPRLAIVERTREHLWREHAAILDEAFRLVD